MIEGFAPPRKQVDAAIRFDRDSAIAIKLTFEGPSLPIGQLRDGSAVHRCDEVGFSFWQRSGFRDSGSRYHFTIAARRAPGSRQSLSPTPFQPPHQAFGSGPSI
jgi:hypothetical protein